MNTWQPAEPARVGATKNCHIVPPGKGGKTRGTPTWACSLAVAADLHARADRGQGSRWQRAAVRQKAGCMAVAGTTRGAALEPANGALNDVIDDTGRRKCGNSPCPASMRGTRARSATARVAAGE